MTAVIVSETTTPRAAAPAARAWARPQPTDGDDALAIVGGCARLGVRAGSSSELDLERFPIAWSEARSLCPIQANLLELAAKALDDAGVDSAREAHERVAVVACHAPTLDDAMLKPEQARVRCQSTSRLLARGLGLAARTLDVAPGALGFPAALDAAHMLLQAEQIEHVLVAISAHDGHAEVPETLVACFVLRRESSARSAQERIRAVLPAPLDPHAELPLRDLAEALRAKHVPHAEPAAARQPAGKARVTHAHPLVAACAACASRSERHALLADDLLSRLGATLGGAQETPVARDTPMDELGLDSLAVVELKQRFERELSARVSLKALLVCRRVDDVAGVLLDALESSHGLRAPELAGTSSASPAARLNPAHAQQLLARLDQLSEHELDLMLENAKGDPK